MTLPRKPQDADDACQMKAAHKQYMYVCHTITVNIYLNTQTHTGTGSVLVFALVIGQLPISGTSVVKGSNDKNLNICAWLIWLTHF